MFWIISAILTLIALAFVVPSLVKKRNNLHDGQREQNIFIANEQLQELETRLEQGEIESEDYQSTRDEIEQSLFSDVSDMDDSSIGGESKPSLIGAILIALLIPAIAIPVYLKVGNLTFTELLDSKQAAARAPGAIPKNADGSPDIDTMVAGLQKKLEAEPNNAKGWYMLGRSYMALKRFPEAAKSYERALKIRPESADIMLSLADSLAMVNKGEIVGRPVSLINKALQLEPNNMTALWLGGMASRQSGDNLTAIQRWKKVIGFLKDPKEIEEVNSLIAEATRGLSPAQQKSLGASVSTADATKKVATKPVESKSGAGISVTISLSDKFKGQVTPTDTVFVYAKAMSGPPMPLAAAKIQVKDLPAEILLNDEMAMMPTMKLSAYSEVIVGARVSKSGGPISQNGDLYAEKKSVKAGDKVQVSIDTVMVK